MSHCFQGACTTSCRCVCIICAPRLTVDPRDAELSDLRARVAELESERLRALKIADALTLDTQSLPEAVDALVEMVRSARRAHDAARRDLEAAQRFEVRHIGVDFDLDDGKWHVWDRVSGNELAVRDDQSAALAEARKLAGEKP